MVTKYLVSDRTKNHAKVLSEFGSICYCTSERHTRMRMRVSSSVPAPFMASFSRRAKYSWGFLATLTENRKSKGIQIYCQLLLIRYWFIGLYCKTPFHILNKRRLARGNSEQPPTQPTKYWVIPTLLKSHASLRCLWPQMISAPTYKHTQAHTKCDEAVLQCPRDLIINGIQDFRSRELGQRVSITLSIHSSTEDRSHGACWAYKINRLIKDIGC